MNKDDPGDPNSHHFTPVFYLRQWANEDGKIIEFREPIAGKLVSKIVGPRGTGFLDGLYTLQGFSEEEKQQIEKDFFSPLDNDASLALQAMLGPPPHSMKPNIKVAWAVFLMSLWIRTPGEVVALKSFVREQYFRSKPALEEEYLRDRLLGDNRSYEEFLKSTPDSFIDSGAVQKLRKLILNKKLRSHIGTMIWTVVDLSSSKLKLLTSDRPWIMTKGLGDPSAHLLMPLSPTKIFVATNEEGPINDLVLWDTDEIVLEVNYNVVSHAEKYVYAQDRSQFKFIREHISKDKFSFVEDKFKGFN